ncbi:Uncharacterised protein [Hungatella hathewayi]|uniref:Uncharacterized protein n=1 Tax=Hungatella hathewayi TaxID=154046 RepID=A0A6N3I1B6_9FIRM
MIKRKLLRAEGVRKNETLICIQKAELGEGNHESVELMTGRVRIDAGIVWALDLLFETLSPSVDHELRIDLYTLNNIIHDLFNNCIGRGLCGIVFLCIEAPGHLDGFLNSLNIVVLHSTTIYFEFASIYLGINNAKISKAHVAPFPELPGVKLHY